MVSAGKFRRNDVLEMLQKCGRRGEAGTSSLKGRKSLQSLTTNTWQNNNGNPSKIEQKYI